MTKDELREKLILAFKDIRKLGIVARVNFKCCNSCASYDIWEMTRKNYKKKPKIGYVFWHKQNEEDLQRRGVLHLAYGTFNDFDDRDVSPRMCSPLSSADVATKVILALVNHGIRCQWDGNEDHKIEVTV
jgi:hypothetical protein